MSSSATPAPEDNDLRRELPPGSDVTLEWSAAFRTHCLVQGHLGGSPPAIRLKLGDDGPQPEVGVTLVLRSGRRPECSWSGRVVDSEGESLVLQTSPDRGNSRSYFRMPVRMTLRIYLPEEPFAEGVRTKTARQTIARVDELSGGGCRLSVSPDSLEVDAVYSARLQLEEDRSPLELRLRALRSTPRGDCDEVAVAFLDLRESDRQRILRRLFEEYRRLRRAAGAAGEPASGTDPSIDPSTEPGSPESGGEGGPKAPPPRPPTPLPGPPAGSR